MPEQFNESFLNNIDTSNDSVIDISELEDLSEPQRDVLKNIINNLSDNDLKLL